MLAIRKWRMQNTLEFFHEPHFSKDYRPLYWLQARRIMSLVYYLILQGRIYRRLYGRGQKWRILDSRNYYAQYNDDYMVRQYRNNEFIWRTEPKDGPLHGEYGWIDYWKGKVFCVRRNPYSSWLWMREPFWPKEWKKPAYIEYKEDMADQEYQIAYSYISYYKHPAGRVEGRDYSIILPYIEFTGFIEKIWPPLMRRNLKPKMSFCENFSKNVDRGDRPFLDRLRENEYKENSVDVEYLKWCDILDEDSSFVTAFKFIDFRELYLPGWVPYSLEPTGIIYSMEVLVDQTTKLANWTIDDPEVELAKVIVNAEEAESIEDKYTLEQRFVNGLKTLDTIINDSTNDLTRKNKHESCILEKTLDNVEESTSLELLEELRAKTFKGVEGLKNTKLKYKEECQEELTYRVKDTVCEQFNGPKMWETYNNARPDPDSPKGIYRREMRGPLSIWYRDYVGFEYGTGNAPFMEGVGAPFLRGGGDPFREDLFLDQEDILIQLRHLEDIQDRNQHSGRADCNNRDVIENVDNTLTWDDIFGIDKWISKWRGEPLELFRDELYSSWDCLDVNKPSLSEIMGIYNNDIDYALNVVDQVGWGVYNFTPAISDTFNWAPLIMISTNTWVNISKPVWVEVQQIQTIMEKVIDDLWYYYFATKPWRHPKKLDFWPFKKILEGYIEDYWQLNYECWFETFCIARAFEDHTPNSWPLRVPITKYPDPEYSWPIRWYSPYEHLYSDPKTYLPQRMVDKMYGFGDTHEHWYSTLIRIDKNLKDELDSDKHYPANRYPWGKSWWNRLYNNSESWPWIDFF